jgi:hypothetical protein
VLRLGADQTRVYGLRGGLFGGVGYLWRMNSHRCSAIVWASLLAMLFVAAFVPRALAQSGNTAFTYQGRLEVSGQPYTGPADVRVQLYRGSQPIGAAATISGVQVTGGLFTISVDLGPELAAFSFLGSPPTYVAASVEISVRTTPGTGAFTTLSPRQSLTPAPSALGLVNFSRAGTLEVNVSQTTDNQVFQIPANVVQTVVPTRNGDVESVDLKLVNTGAPAPLTLTLRSSAVIFGTSTVTVPAGTNIVTFPFPVGTNIATTSALRLDFNTTNAVGARYATGNPYAPGSANFSSDADFFFTLRLRGEGSWLSPLSLAINSKDAEPLSVTGFASTGASIRLSSAAVGGLPWLLTATAPLSADGSLRFRLKPEFSASPAGLTMDQVGNVGINKLSPTAPLHVGGNLAVDGTIVLPTTTRQYNVPATACSTIGSIGGVTVTGTGSVSGATAGQVVSLNAPLQLPNGAVITKIRYALQDNAAEDVSIALRAASMSAGSAVVVSSSTTSGAVNGFGVTTLDVPVPASVDNTNFYYFIRATWTTPTTPGNIAVRSLGVEYTVTSPLP